MLTSIRKLLSTGIETSLSFVETTYLLSKIMRIPPHQKPSLREFARLVVHYHLYYLPLHEDSESLKLIKLSKLIKTMEEKQEETKSEISPEKILATELRKKAAAQRTTLLDLYKEQRKKFQDLKQKEGVSTSQLAIAEKAMLNTLLEAAMAYPNIALLKKTSRAFFQARYYTQSTQIQSNLIMSAKLEAIADLLARFVNHDVPTIAFYCYYLSARPDLFSPAEQKIGYKVCSKQACDFDFFKSLWLTKEEKKMSEPRRLDTSVSFIGYFSKPAPSTYTSYPPLFKKRSP